MLDSLAGGGTQQALYDYLRWADQNRLQFCVVALTSTDDVFSDRIRRYAEVEFVHPGRNSALSLLHPAYWLRLRHLILSLRPDILHARLNGSLFFGSILSRTLGVSRFVYTIEASEKQERYPWIRSAYYKFFLNHVDVVYTNYPQEYKSMGLPQSRMRPYQTTIELDQAAAKPEAIGSEEQFCSSRPILVSVGRLHPDKGHQYAIHLMEMIRDLMPGARLFVCGEGSYRQELECLIDSLGLRERVKLIGYTPDVDWLLKRADIFLSLMVNEPLNLAASRAMMWDLPIMAFNTGLTAHVQIREGSNGCQLPLRDLSSGPEKLQLLLKLKKQLQISGATALIGSRELAKKYDQSYLDLVFQG